MTKKEWLDIGFDKGIIDLENFEEITFLEAYREWFKMKMTFVKKQSLDRMECTYNRHYSGTDIENKYISKITDTDIITYLMRCCLCSAMTYRELGRIMQIIKGVLTYMRDIDRGGSPLHDWEKIKRNLPLEKLESGFKQEYAVSRADTEKLLHDVLVNKIYYQKHSASLCLCLNFYLGLRIGELAALSFSDFDLDKNVVRITKTESKFYNRDEDGSRLGTMVYRVVDSTKTVYSVREIPLMPEALYIFEEIKKHHALKHYNSPYLAYDGNQTVLIRSLDRTLRRLIQLCELRRFSSHDIRKTFATILHHNGVPTRVISDLMGHSEIGTTENCYILSYDNSYKEYLQYMRDAIKYVI
ncbi:MAG: site-specific integrase [Lachnospiraceae bacterium]|nr:site-specific integrase [Lachnospiraceae bacterium]